MNVLWAVCLLLSACGSSQTAAPSAANPAANGGDAERSGRIFLRNETSYPVEVAYVYTEGESGLRLFRSLIDTGSRKALSYEVIPANVRIDLDVVLQVPADVGPRVRRKAPVEIRGDVDLRVYLAAASDPFYLIVEPKSE